jgi:hypothetical protein
MAGNGKVALKNGTAAKGPIAYIIATQDGTVVGSLSIPPLASARNSEKSGKPYVYGPVSLMHEGRQVENRNTILWLSS